MILENLNTLLKSKKNQRRLELVQSIYLLRQIEIKENKMNSKPLKRSEIVKEAKRYKKIKRI